MFKHQIFKTSGFILTIVLVILISEQLYFRIDLTKDKRFTLSNTTRRIAKDIDDILFIRVYLDEDLPPGFRRFRNSIRDILDEIRVLSGNNVQYEFISPSAIADEGIRDDLYKSLISIGVEPTNVMITEQGGGQTRKIVFPGAVITYKGVEMPVNFLKNNPSLSHEINLNNSIQNIEYELISSFYALIDDNTKKVAFLEGHGELNEFFVAGFSDRIVKYYDIYRGRIDPDDPNCLDDYDALIIAKPINPFSENEKFIIDQYIMKGGRVMWFIDPVAIDLDSLSESSEAVAMINDINLTDQLFRYGVRLNPNLIMDMNCLLIPVDIALGNEPPRFIPAPWFYSPILAGNPDHPVTRGINYVKSEFASVIDTVGNDPLIRRDVLLKSSPATRVVNAPLLVSLNMISNPPSRSEFNMPGQSVAVMLEGKFPSVFTNRIVQEITGLNVDSFIERSVQTRMIVVSDGDIIRNDVTVTGGVPEPVPLGYDRYSSQTYGNADFAINALNFLMDESGVMDLRSREVTIRLLDRNKITENIFLWQLLNLLLPVIIIITGGVIFNIVRKRIYSY